MIYFASDFHLGAPTEAASAKRERLILQWFDKIEADVEELFLVGDIFDLWFDYKNVVPRGFVRVMARIAALTDRGVSVHYFMGNHDQWMLDYFQKELGVIMYADPIRRQIGDKWFFIGHGDGLGPGDHGYKRIKKLFRHPLSRWLFRWVHPDIGVPLARWFSRKSRASQGFEENYLGDENEWLLTYANHKLTTVPEIDYFIFGHRHLPLDITLSNGHSRYINLGEWFHAQTYAHFDGQTMKLVRFGE